MSGRVAPSARLGRAALAGAVLLVLAGCGAAAPAGPPITVTGAWARPALEGNPTAVYMAIHNAGDVEDHLLSISVAVAASAEVHETVREGDLVRMVPRQRLPIPAGGTAVLEPGGTHVMLMKLGDALEIGDSVAMTLGFARGGTVVVNATVQEGAPAAGDGAQE